MTTEPNQPQADNGAEESTKKHHRWQRTGMIARCFGCWIRMSVRNPDNIPVYLTAIFTAFLVLFAYYAWDEATRGTKAIQGQLEILKDGQRPWVGAPTEIKTSVAPGGKVTFIQIFRNVGHTPTKGFYIDGKIISWKTDWYSEVVMMCKTAIEVVTNGNQKRISPFTSIPGNDWPLDVVSMPSLLGKSFTIESLKQIGTPVIIGCVLYGSPFDTIIHKTGYIARIDVDGNNASIGSIYAVDAD
jgi:hypothetical protein